MRPACLALLLLAGLPAPVAGEIYKWTDAAGRVHYSDTATSPKAEVVTVRVNSYRSVTYESLRQGPVRRDPARVVMYGTRWCGYCKKARQYFEANGIAYADLDIEQSKVALAEFQAIGGRGVPVILVGSRRMNGFDAAGFRRLQKQAQDDS